MPPKSRLCYIAFTLLPVSGMLLAVPVIILLLVTRAGWLLLEVK